jgi:hypothetical protein
MPKYVRNAALIPPDWIISLAEEVRSADHWADHWAVHWEVPNAAGQPVARWGVRPAEHSVAERWVVEHWVAVPAAG